MCLPERGKNKGRYKSDNWFSNIIFRHLIHVLLITLPFFILPIVNFLSVNLELRLFSFLSLLLIGYSFGADYFTFADEVDLFEETDSEKMDLLDHFIETKE